MTTTTSPSFPLKLAGPQGVICAEMSPEQVARLVGDALLWLVERDPAIGSQLLAAIQQGLAVHVEAVAALQSFLDGLDKQPPSADEGSQP